MPTPETFTFGEAENAAGLAAEMQGDPRFREWMEAHADRLSGWSGFIHLTLRVGKILEQVCPTDDVDAWDSLGWYEALDVVADALLSMEADDMDDALLTSLVRDAIETERTRQAAAEHARVVVDTREEPIITTDDEDDEDEPMNLIQLITKEMTSDMDNWHPKQSRLLTEAYEEADDAGKDLLDRAFICLCGWSLKTLIEKAEKPYADEDGNEDEEDSE